MITYTLSDRLTTRKLQNEFFVFDRVSGMVHMFNETGGIFWNHVSSGEPFETIVASITTEYETSREQVAEDLFLFIQQLAEKSLLTITD